jgi:hypothetical protein
MSSAYNTIIAIELVLLTFSVLGIFSLPLKSVSKQTAILLKIFFSLSLISIWASLFWSDLYHDFDHYLIVMFVVHLLFLVLSVIAIFSISRNITIRWIRYFLRLIGFAFIIFLEYIMAVVVLIGY